MKMLKEIGLWLWEEKWWWIVPFLVIQAIIWFILLTQDYNNFPTEHSLF